MQRMIPRQYCTGLNCQLINLEHHVLSCKRTQHICLLSGVLFMFTLQKKLCHTSPETWLLYTEKVMYSVVAGVILVLRIVKQAM